MNRLGRLFNKRALWVGLGILGLAGVIFVGGALSSDRTPSSAPDTGLTPAGRAAEYADSAAVALSENDTSSAVSLAQKSLALDPANTSALQTVESAKAAPTVSEGSTTPEPDDPPSASPATPPSDDGYLDAIKDLGSLLPDEIEDWTAGRLVAVSPDALITFEPDPSSPDDASVVRVVFSVHDMKTPSDARRFITNVSMVAYSKDKAELGVGVVQPYFGTDGNKVAVAVFTRGRFVFESQIIAVPGVDPKTLKQAAETLVSEYSAAMKE